MITLSEDVSKPDVFAEPTRVMKGNGEDGIAARSPRRDSPGVDIAASLGLEGGGARINELDAAIFCGPWLCH
ncbi:MAG: hypothetical protein HYX92_04195 [Chloroflexi bacterium]|nr:hypothetical protein [Chloroflexota bacterium]